MAPMAVKWALCPIHEACKMVWKPNVTVAAVIERDGKFLLVEEETDDGIRVISLRKANPREVNRYVQIQTSN